MGNAFVVPVVLAFNYSKINTGVEFEFVYLRSKGFYKMASRKLLHMVHIYIYIIYSAESPVCVKLH